MEGMEKSVLSVAPMTFKGNDGKDRTMYKVYIADETGCVGCIYSNNAYQPGDIVTLCLAVNKDGRFTVRIQQ